MIIWRGKRLQARLNHNLKLVRNLEIELEAARIRVPEGKDHDALIHGRVVSHSGVPDEDDPLGVVAANRIPDPKVFLTGGAIIGFIIGLVYYVFDKDLKD